MLFSLQKCRKSGKVPPPNTYKSLTHWKFGWCDVFVFSSNRKVFKKILLKSFNQYPLFTVGNQSPFSPETRTTDLQLQLHFENNENAEHSWPYINGGINWIYSHDFTLSLRCPWGGSETYSYYLHCFHFYTKRLQLYHERSYDIMKLLTSSLIGCVCLDALPRTSNRGLRLKYMRIYF